MTTLYDFDEFVEDVKAFQHEASQRGYILSTREAIQWVLDWLPTHIEQLEQVRAVAGAVNNQIDRLCMTEFTRMEQP